jgi:hypothetical protein
MSCPFGVKTSSPGLSRFIQIYPDLSRFNQDLSRIYPDLVGLVLVGLVLVGLVLVGLVLLG